MPNSKICIHCQPFEVARAIRDETGVVVRIRRGTERTPHQRRFQKWLRSHRRARVISLRIALPIERHHPRCAVHFQRIVDVVRVPPNVSYLQQRFAGHLALDGQIPIVISSGAICRIDLVGRIRNRLVRAGNCCEARNERRGGRSGQRRNRRVIRLQSSKPSFHTLVMPMNLTCGAACEP